MSSSESAAMGLGKRYMSDIQILIGRFLKNFLKDFQFVEQKNLAAQQLCNFWNQSHPLVRFTNINLLL